MARRNKKKRRQDGFVFPAPFAGFVVLVSSLALAYVWLGCRCEALGRDLRGLEERQAELRKVHANEAYKWAQKKSPRSIEQALRRHGITMIWPNRGQVVRLSDSDLLEGLHGMDPGDVRRFAGIGRRNELEGAVLHE